MFSDIAWALGSGKGRFWLSREGGQLPDTRLPVAGTGGSLPVTGPPESCDTGLLESCDTGHISDIGPLVVLL